jgi:hypothetical protein
VHGTNRSARCRDSLSYHTVFMHRYPRAKLADKLRREKTKVCFIKKVSMFTVSVAK